MRPPPVRRRRVVPLLLCLALATAWAGSGARAAGSKKRDPSIFVRFHAQVSTFDPSFAAKVVAGNPPRELIVEKIPSLSERDIVSFYPYKANDGTFSAVFQLDPHGQAVLEALSAQLRGRSIVAAVNGRPLALLKVDKTVTDGIIFIPSGLTEADIRSLGASFSLIGQTDSDKAKAKEPPPSGPFTGPGQPRN